MWARLDTWSNSSIQYGPRPVLRVTVWALRAYWALSDGASVYSTYSYCVRRGCASCVFGLNFFVNEAMCAGANMSLRHGGSGLEEDI